MPKTERKEYEEHIWNLSYQRSVLQAHWTEGQMEGRKEGRAEAREEMIQKMRSLGVGEDVISQF